VLDTETTGLNPADGHRIVEIGCIELFNHVPTGQTFQKYLNPERPMPAEALAVHGLTDEFLVDQPLMEEVIDDFIEFIGDARLVIHNAEFDMRFLNAELERLNRPHLDFDRAIDTVGMARRKFPGAQASLDALCRRFEIDNSGRNLHGALLDAQLLAEVYLELIGGRQPGLELAAEAVRPEFAESSTPRVRREHAPSAEELARHAAFVETLEDPIWSK
jgi:DNA polymerase-3 subunit epsilon